MVSSHDLKLTLELKACKKLLVSSRSAQFDPLVDLNFARIHRRNSGDTLLFPASTFKGVLRTSLIRVAHLLGYEAKPTVHPAALTRSSSGDIACRLFGRPHTSPSKIFVKPVELDDKSSAVTHVTIEDKTKCAMEGQLYTAEYLPIHHTFKLEVEGKGLTTEEAEALFAALANLSFERVGRGGLLKVKIRVNESTIPEELRRNETIGEILEAIGY